MILSKYSHVFLVIDRIIKHIFQISHCSCSLMQNKLHVLALHAKLVCVEVLQSMFVVYSFQLS